MTSTLADLSASLRNPLPQKKSVTRQYFSALEAFHDWKPLTLEDVRERMAKERIARDLLLQEYRDRTGLEIDYCDECDLGVVEEEVPDRGGTIVFESECRACDGLGVVESPSAETPTVSTQKNATGQMAQVANSTQ